MSNSSLILSNSSVSPFFTLDELLDSLGFEQWITIPIAFVLPSINVIGTILCTVSAFIFLKRRFADPVFYYYRLLCIINILNLIHNIPYGLLYSPRYFSRMNTYLSSLFLIYYVPATVFLFHFEDIVQMGILLDRMKIFSSYVKKHVSAAKPQVLC